MILSMVPPRHRETWLHVPGRAFPSRLSLADHGVRATHGETAKVVQALSTCRLPVRSMIMIDNGDNDAIWGFLWLSIVFDGYLWFSMVFHGFLWFSVVFDGYGFLWLSMVVYGFLWFSVVIYGFRWFSMVVDEYLWLSMAICNYQI